MPDAPYDAHPRHIGTQQEQMVMRQPADDLTADDLAANARAMRRTILDMAFACGKTAHLGGGLSEVDLLATLYTKHLRFQPDNPRWDQRDLFILSKGHGVLGYFAALHQFGVIDDATLATFKHDGGPLIAHPVMNLDLGIESSNGSLGQGLSFAIGWALGARKRGATAKAYVLLGDGECNEGSVWEAAMLAPQLGLDNLIAMVDLNGMQSDGASTHILDQSNMAERWRAFGWDVHAVDGHDVNAIDDAFTAAKATPAKPSILVANTVKGKGISFMEHENAWHHNRLTQKTYDQALLELGYPVETHNATADTRKRA